MSDRSKTPSGPGREPARLLGKDRLTPARLGVLDVVRVGAAGLRSRPTRVVLSALGIALGVATVIAVMGVASSSRAGLQRELDSLGTDMLTVAPGDRLLGGRAELPKKAEAMIRAVGPVRMTGQTGDTGAPIFRTDRIPADRTAGLQVRATSLDLLRILRTPVRHGTWLNAATAAQRAVVLGTTAADRLGVTAGDPVWVGGQWWTVVGVLEESPLAEEVDASALVGFPAAAGFLGFDGHPTTIYVRSADEHVQDVRSVLARTANPEHPEEVTVSRPSDALAARAAASGAFVNVLLGVGGVALLVGGVGVANTMVVSVLERRGEIGLRRSLGATRGQVRLQFLMESLLLSGLGGAGGVVLGVVAVHAYAAWRGLPPVAPAWTLGGGLAVTLLVGVVAGIYPAARAARMPPTLALSVT
ncbi:ABC transporter permease [Streptosporangium carneum]|uniref:ABC transporter permease n=1 Tax=Streptosporangium carneum TaxID=47481 RepID=A0A9W6I8W0_9ACTN|nr:ABC transporter permease [Streptosporangium carneum]GLK13566.1 ABC transporter permease [Streptosporangium carneum]